MWSKTGQEMWGRLAFCHEMGQGSDALKRAKTLWYEMCMGCGAPHPVCMHASDVCVLKEFGVGFIILS